MHKTILISETMLELKATHMKVVVVLKGHANAARQCWPSYTTIAKKARMGAGAVKRILNQIESLGFVTIETRGGRSNLYTLDERFFPGDAEIGSLAKRRGSSRPRAPAPLLEPLERRLHRVQSESTDRGHSESTGGLSLSPEVLQLKSTNPNGLAAAAAPTGVSPKKFWQNAIAFLIAHGVQRRRAHGLLASWRRDHGDGVAVGVLMRAERAGVSDPVSFIEADLGGSHGIDHSRRGAPRRSFSSVVFEVSQRLAQRNAEPGDRHGGDGQVEGAGESDAARPRGGPRRFGGV